MLHRRLADMSREAKELTIPRETLKAMIRDYQGFDLSDAELDLIRPELDNYMAELENLGELDLSGVLSARLLRVMEGGESDA